MAKAKHDLSKEQEQELISQFRKWYDAALEGPNYLASDADEIAAIYEDQRQVTRMSEKCCDISVNLFFRICQVIVGKLSDQRQTAEYGPRGDPSKRIIAMVRTEQFRAHWGMYDCDQVWEEAAEDAAKLGMGWVKGGYDPEAFCHPDTGKFFADMVPERVDPHMVLVDAACTRLDLKNARYVFHLKWMGNQEIADLAGVDVDEVGDENWDAEVGDESRWDLEPNEYGQRLVAEIWWDCQDKDEKGKKKYPYGRVTVCTAGRVLMDRPSPFETAATKFPFFPVVFIRVPDTVSGIPMGRYLLKAQKWFNILMATVIDNARLTCYINTYVNKASGIKTAAMHNGPGQFIPYDPAAQGQPVFQLQPVSVPPYVERILDRILFLIEWVSGYVEVSQGRQPGSVRSGRGIDFLRQEADTGLRLYARRMSYAIKQYARLCLYVFSEMYEEARVIRVYGMNYDRAKAAYLQYKEKLKEQMLLSIAKGEMTADEGLRIEQDKEAWADKQHVRQIGKDDVTAYYEVLADKMAYAMDVEIIPDSSSPWSREARDQKGLVLVQNGLPFSIYVKYMADVPMRNEELLAELREFEQKKMQMEMAALQEKGKSQGPGGVPQLTEGAIPQNQELMAQTQAGVAGQQ